MSKGQKEAVIEQVELALGSRFVKYQTNAILVISASELETVKANIQAGIQAGLVEYSKDKTNTSEVRSYARSMVMNHLKKAKELNGGHAYVSTSSNTNNASATKTKRTKVKLAPKGVDPDLLTEELKELARSLV